MVSSSWASAGSTCDNVYHDCPWGRCSYLVTDIAIEVPLDIQKRGISIVAQLQCVLSMAGRAWEIKRWDPAAAWLGRGGCEHWYLAFSAFRKVEERGGYGRGARRAICPVYNVGGHGREGAGHGGVEASGRRERMLGGERRWRRRVRRQVRGLCVLCHGVREDARIVGACGMELRAQNAGFKGSERHPHMAFPAIH